jgi:hypothetical protein
MHAYIQRNILFKDIYLGYHFFPWVVEWSHCGKVSGSELHYVFVLYTEICMLP